MTKPIDRDPIYRRRRFDAEIIELCVRWYITCRLSYRDLVAMMAERGSGLRNVAGEFHSLMQDSDDVDAFGDEAVKQEMRAAGNFVVARAYVGAFLSYRRTRCYFLDALPNIAGIRLRLIQSPAVSRVIPNIVEVALSAR
jgi:hypothetical protein